MVSLGRGTILEYGLVLGHYETGHIWELTTPKATVYDIPGMWNVCGTLGHQRMEYGTSGRVSLWDVDRRSSIKCLLTSHLVTFASAGVMILSYISLSWTSSNAT